MKQKLLAKIYSVGKCSDDDFIDITSTHISSFKLRGGGGGSGCGSASGGASGSGSAKQTKQASPFRTVNITPNSGQIASFGYPSSVLDSITSTTRGIDRSL